jgi:hypothetical protein
MASDTMTSTRVKYISVGLLIRKDPHGVCSELHPSAYVRTESVRVIPLVLSSGPRMRVIKVQKSR